MVPEMLNSYRVDIADLPTVTFIAGDCKRGKQKSKSRNLPPEFKELWGGGLGALVHKHLLTRR